MGDTGFPLNPDQLTPEWLTDALRQDACTTGTRVVSLTYEMIGAAMGSWGRSRA